VVVPPFAVVKDLATNGRAQVPAPLVTAMAQRVHPVITLTLLAP